MGNQSQATKIFATCFNLSIIKNNPENDSKGGLLYKELLKTFHPFFCGPFLKKSTLFHKKCPFWTISTTSLNFPDYPSFSTNIEYHTRTYSSCFMHAIVARMRLPFLNIFSNFVHFCSNLQIFCPFLHFLLTNRTHALSF